MFYCKGLTSLPEGLFSGLTSRENIVLDGCDNLVLSDGLREEKEENARRRAKAEAEALFAEIDKDGDGHLTMADLFDVFTLTGQREVTRKKLKRRLKWAGITVAVQACAHVRACVPE